MKSLFKEFKKSSKKDWLAKVEKDLKGKPIESLDWKINKSLTVSPFATSSDLSEPPTPFIGKRKTNEWEKGIWIFIKNYKSSNREALLLLEKGADALCFEFSKNPTKKELEILLNGIELEWISIHSIFPGKTWKSVVKSFIEIAESRNSNLKKISGSIQFKNKNTFPPNDFSTLQDYFQKLPSFNFVTINARNFYFGKNEIIEEISTTISTVNTLLEKWNKKNLNLKSLVSKIQLSIQIDDSFYLSLSKIRTLKLLWQLLLKGWKISNVDCPIEVHLTSTTQTKDENYNKIKATSQAISAVIGGANRLYIYPSDTFKNNKGTQNQQRLSLNIQHLMELESSMNRVIDPAAGSYFLEKLTDDLAEKAWKRFVTST